jgi:uncharacterized protein YciI
MRTPQLICSLLALTFITATALAQETPDKRPSWFIFLETGKPTPADKAAVQKMQAGHIENFKRLHGERKLFAAGPLADPTRKQRGIVVVKANTKKELLSYFGPDDYVREGYMTVNAERCVVHQPLNSEGIDPAGIEEVRIVQITRPEKKPTRRERQANEEFLQSVVKQGTAGAWYTLEAGPRAEVLFCRTTNTATLESVFAEVPTVKAGKTSALIWPQWLSKGVVK